MNGFIFDTHAHYDDPSFDNDREELLSDMKSNGIGCIVNIAADVPSLTTTPELASKYDFMYATLGIHPSYASEITEDELKYIKSHLLDEKIVAIGEIGLDYHYDGYKKEDQIEVFEKQLQIAKEFGLPVVIHSRDAAEDTLAIMKNAHAEGIGGVIHCFSGSVDYARKYIDMGYMIGIGGVLTYSNARKLVEVADYAPLTSIVLETDCPYLAPVPFRGKRNQSPNLKYVAEKLAEIKKTDRETIADITYDNALKLYRLSDSSCNYLLDT